MTDQPRLALTFEDVLLVPRRSSIRSRRHCMLAAALAFITASDQVTSCPFCS